jgi:3-hydroxy-9,10-secoandrosta-1,3,5(10)-triene-9,17-dione monooxygenase reductase component
MPDTTAIDPRAFRDALGNFVTGVTIVTACDEAGRDTGLTANSFNSVSLDPPMVLWSLALSSSSLPAFRHAPWWAVHILASDQEALSGRFAKRGVDKFEGLSLTRGPGGIPLLEGCAARFICRTAYEYEGGDHAIFVGEVLEFDREGRTPLVYHQGRYGGVIAGEGPGGETCDPDFSAHFLGHWLGLAHGVVFGDVRREIRARGLTLADYTLLTVLGLGESRCIDDVVARAVRGGLEQPGEAIDAAVAGGLISVAGGLVRLTEAGRGQAVELVAVAQSSQMRIEDRLAPAEITMLRHLLQRVVEE